ncbi:MAG: efflux RND transporter periplasmic adaptor subunit [Oleiphilaceae bacterium]|nr:efflux RND transporter periplasmic adaptor subunit [Oleiphilaceae bacterium]
MVSRFLSLGSLLVLSFAVLVGCSSKEENAPEQAQQMPPAVSVQVASVTALTMAATKIYTGRLEAEQEVIMTPQVSGQIKHVTFEEGAVVKQGDVLFEMHSRTQAARYNELKAELESARAQIELAKRDVERAVSLRKKNSLSQEELDNRRTELTKSISDAAALEAAVDGAATILSYTKIKAPIDGRASNAFVKEGTWITQGRTELTELVSTDRYHAYFDVDESTYLELKALSASKLDNVVLMGIGTAFEFPFQGYIDFVDNKIDITTGTIRLRAVFEDKQQVLTAGLFVRLMVRVEDPKETVLVKETAIATDLNSKYVLVVDENNMSQYRPIQTGLRYGSLRAVSGLAPDETIIVSGLQRVFPGMPVAPENVEMVDAAFLEELKKEQTALVSQ